MAATTTASAKAAERQARLNILASVAVEGHRQAEAPEVKAWGRKHGFTVSDKQGRLANDLIDGFNAAGDKRKVPVQYVVGTKTSKAQPVTYTYTTAAGRKGKFTALPTEVRAWALDNGYTATKGRFSQALLDGYGQARNAK